MKTKFKILIIAFTIPVTILLLDISCRYNIIKLDGLSGEILGLIFKTDTKYSDLYSDKKFNKIKIGMSEHDVLEIIGTPITKWKPYLNNENYIDKSNYEGFVYSESPSSTHYRLRQINFNNGKVAEIISYFYVD
jgi:hypothetical protein